MRIVYMGTPEIAARVLQSVSRLPVEIVGAFTQPDKPVGRGRVLTKPPVKVLAEQLGIPVFQPKRVKGAKAMETLRQLKPDLILVTAYGQLLSQAILELPAFGCINMHASLLPKYRGAAPIQWAIVRGETETGVTAMQMDIGMDTGDMLRKVKVPIAPQETANSLYEKLADAAAALACEVVKDLLQGKPLVRTPQPEAQATYAPIIQKEDGKADWHMSAEQLERRVRGLCGWPGVYALLDGKKLTILEAAALPENGSKAPGTVLEDALEGKHPHLYVQTGNGILWIKRLQLQGKKAMDDEAFLRGNPMKGKTLCSG